MGSGAEEEYLTLDSPFLDVIPYLDVEPCPEPGEALWFTPMRDLTRETFTWFAEGTREFLFQIVRDPTFFPVLWTARSTNGKNHKLFRLKGGGRLELYGLLPFGSSPDLDFEVSASVPIEDLFRSLGPFMEAFAAYVYEVGYGEYLTDVAPMAWEPGTVQDAEQVVGNSFAIRQYRNDTRGDQGIRVFASVNGYQDAILDFKILHTPGILVAYTLPQLLEQNLTAIQNRTAMIIGAMGAYRSAILNLELLDPEMLGPALREELSARRSIGFNRIKVRNHYDRFNALLSYAIENIERVPEDERAQFITELKAVVIAFAQWLGPRRDFPSLEEIRAWTRVDPERRKTFLQITLETIGISEDVGAPLVAAFQTAAQVVMRPAVDPQITHATYDLIVRKLVDPASIPRREVMSAKEVAAQREATRSPVGRAFAESLALRARQASPTGGASGGASGGSPAPAPRVVAAAPGITRTVTATPRFTRLPTATPSRIGGASSGLPKNL